MQDVYSVNKADYDAQKAPCNLTIQHAVAASVPSGTPERVTDIVVVEEEEERRRNMRALATSGTPRPVSLKYKVTVFDPLLPAEVLTAQLIAKARSGEMTLAIRTFAVFFNATSMQNCTLADPKITVLNEAYHGDPATPGEIAGVVVGGFLFVVLLTVGVWLFVRWLKNDESGEGQNQQLPPATLASAA